MYIYSVNNFPSTAISNDIVVKSFIGEGFRIDCSKLNPIRIFRVYMYMNRNALPSRADLTCFSRFPPSLFFGKFETTELIPQTPHSDKPFGLITAPRNELIKSCETICAVLELRFLKRRLVSTKSNIRWQKPHFQKHVDNLRINSTSYRCDKDATRNLRISCFLVSIDS